MRLHKSWTWIATVTILGIGLYGLTNGFGSFAEASTTSPGSVDDPVVTKSYVDQKIAELQGGTIPAPSAAPTAAPPSTPSTGGQAATLTVVTLKAGQTLYAGAGAEFIVRTGKVVAVSSDENGIPDVTVGKDLAAGTAVELNHLLIFPREGRGIKPDPKSKADIYVMVRGSYLLVNADGSVAGP